MTSLRLAQRLVRSSYFGAASLAAVVVVAVVFVILHGGPLFFWRVCIALKNVVWLLTATGPQTGLWLSVCVCVRAIACSFERGDGSVATWFSLFFVEHWCVFFRIKLRFDFC